ncbi:MAG: trimethylamine methyltransferase family protein, partial [Aggregatilineales bacterium]
AIADVGHGGHFFGTQHTLDRFETAFYSPLLSDWDNFENWADRGSVDATTRASHLFWGNAATRSAASAGAKIKTESGSIPKILSSMNVLSH